jgi:hypothetical protein
LGAVLLSKVITCPEVTGSSHPTVENRKHNNKRKANAFFKINTPLGSFHNSVPFSDGKINRKRPSFTERRFVIGLFFD